MSTTATESKADAKADQKGKGNKPPKPKPPKTDEQKPVTTEQKPEKPASIEPAFSLSEEEFNALPEKMQKKILKVRESITQRQQATQQQEQGKLIFKSTIAKLIEMGYVDEENKAKVKAITINAEGEVTFGKARKKRTIKPKDDNKADNKADDEKTEDDEKAEVKAEATLLRKTLVKFYKDEEVSQADIIRGMGRGRSPKPSQATVSNWLKGASLPSAKYHAGLRRLLVREEYLDA